MANAPPTDKGNSRRIRPAVPPFQEPGPPPRRL